MYRNQSRDLFNDGSDITATATAELAGKTFTKISGPMADNLVQVTTADPGGPTAGVAKYDAAAGYLVGLARGSARVLTVTAEDTLSAGDLVQVGSAGGAVVAVGGIAVGYAVDAAEAGTDAKISLL